jgi:DNA-binding XRE family transcriptional regulator
MKAAKKKRLEAAGWKIGTTEDFLGLSPEEARIVKMKLALGDSLRRHRIRRHWTQLDLAKRLGSSQSRVAKLETGALGVTLDLMFRALFVAGVSTDEIARELRSRRRSAA